MLPVVALRALLFDLFDTLVDLRMEDLPEYDIGGRRVRSTDPILHTLILQRVEIDFETFAAALRESDRELFRETYQQGLELPTLRRFQALTQRLEIDDPALAEELTQAHMRKIQEQVRSLPHHPSVLGALHDRYRIGVVSNFSHAETAYSILENADLIQHIDHVIISEETGVRKPRPEIFHAALNALEVKAADCAHVGDRLRDDVTGASSAGIDPIWLTRRVSSKETLLRDHDGPAPSMQIDDLAELLVHLP